MTWRGGGSRMIAVPSGDLAFTESSRTYDPRTVGSDGLVYAREAASPTFDRMVRSSTAFSTVETGFDFTGASGSENMIWCTRTTDGYVAITRDTALDVGHIWFSTSFTADFTSVQTIRGTQLLAIANPAYPLNGGSAVLLVGEYQSATPSSDAKLWASFDGGQTWSNIKTKSPVSSSVNSHWHNACYDPHTKAIWASGGDGVNAYFAYTLDQGSNWVDVVVPADSPVYDGNGTIQPTLIIALRHQMCICPDRGSLFTGIWNVDKATGTVRTSKVAAPIRTDQQYGAAPYATSGYDEAYVVYVPSGSTSDTAYWLATGDGGKSWWNVGERALAGGSVDGGIVGVDAAGKVYCQAFLGGASKILSANKLTWTWRMAR